MLDVAGLANGRPPAAVLLVGVVLAPAAAAAALAERIPRPSDLIIARTAVSGNVEPKSEVKRAMSLLVPNPGAMTSLLPRLRAERREREEDMGKMEKR